MEITIQTVLSQNITVVYDALDLAIIDIGKLKTLFDVKIQPTIMDTPELIVAVFPPEPIIIQFGERRIRITLPKKMDTVGEVPLWEIAAKCLHLVPGNKFSTVAIGYNYDVGIALAEDAYDVVKKLFISDIKNLNQSLDGELFSFVPRIMFKRGNTRYDFVLEPLDEHRIKAHLNAHFDLNGNQFPSPTELQESYISEFGYFTNMLTTLLKGD